MGLTWRPNRRDVLIGGVAIAGSALSPRNAGAGDNLNRLFASSGVTGTFVRLDLQTDRVTLVNEARAQRRYIPASTFKIPNSLIALETGVTAPADVFAWNGQPRAMAQWQADMTLKDAIRTSNVPVFQDLARRIGLPAYEDWLDRLGYGNANPGTHVDRFWLEGPLTISAIEQTSFLAALALDQLPFRRDVQQSVKEMLLVETRGARKLFGKTGWLRAAKPDIGWWVGWVEGEGRIDTFALNIDIAAEADLPKRIDIGRAMLAELGLFPR